MVRVVERETVNIGMNRMNVINGLTSSTRRIDQRFAPISAKMHSAGLPQLVIDIFRHYYTQLLAGETGFIHNREASPVSALPYANDLSTKEAAAGWAALDRTIVLKLNGGLGTSMGMHGPKSLLPAKDQHSFLDIIIQQVLHLRQQSGARLPLVLMNSFNTERQTLAEFARYPTFAQSLQISFLQHKEPKICKDDFSPAVWPTDPNKEWCPPGHGDIYPALVTSGMLSAMLKAGYEYLFVSNSDNLGATLDLQILGYLAQKNIPFLMEVAYRTISDRKGGHLAQRPDGQLILRELAQCPPEEVEQFQDIERYRYFNTNNLWIHLPTLDKLLRERHGVLGLPLIRNEKPIDPTNPHSYRVYQLETAMGSAIASFPGAQALCVPRSRFVPVKKNNDLLVLWSDAYRLTPEFYLELNRDPSTPPNTPPTVYLDDRYYGLIDDMRARFPYGAPSLINCAELHVEGNVYFGKNVTICGAVQIINHQEAPLWVEEGSTLVDQRVER